MQRNQFIAAGNSADCAMADSKMFAGYLKRSGMHELTDDAVRDMSENGQRYYMILPRKYLFVTGTRIFLMFFVSVMVCWNLLTVMAPPMFLYSGMRYYYFVRRLFAVNVSKKKMYAFLAVWLIVCAVINILFWNWLETIR